MDVAKNKCLRYVSVAALIVDQQREKFLVAKRSTSDSYEAGSVVLPSGRVEGNEKLKERLLLEIAEEIGIAVDEESIVYIDECTFLREGYPVNQLCFGAVAKETIIPSRSEELKSIEWITPDGFYNRFKEKGYVGELFAFVRKAQEIGLLRNSN